MKKFLLCLFLILSSALSAQELITNKFEKGYVVDGIKDSVWEYYNNNEELELKIDYTTGNVFYLREDTTKYVIFKDGRWIKEKLRIYPIPVEGYHNFYSVILQNVEYPAEARNNKIEGKVLVMFEIDTLGFPANYTIVNEIGAGCGDKVIETLRRTEQIWIPARIGKTNYTSRFILPVVFNLGQNQNLTTISNLPLARELEAVVISAIAIGSDFGSSAPNIPLSALSLTPPEKTFTSLQLALNSQSKVERLSLSGNRIGVLSGDIGKLNDLRFLDLERNDLNELPIEILNLDKLRELYLPENKLTHLPDGIDTLKALKTLSLASNQFSEFPEQICALTKLEILDLGDNNLSSIPTCISALTKLKVIVLQKNNFKTLPDEFFKLKNLQSIYLNNNPLDKETIQKLKTSFKKAEILFD